MSDKNNINNEENNKSVPSSDTTPNIKKVLTSAKMYYGLNSYANLFKDCNSLEEVDLTGVYNKEDVKNTKSTFEGCTNIEKIDMSNWDTSGITSSKKMFTGVPELYLDGWNYDGTTYEEFELTEEEIDYNYEFPWNMFYIEYTVEHESTNKVDYSYRRNSNETYYYYLPLIYSDANTKDAAKYIYINKKDGTRTLDYKNCSVDEVESIRVYYPKNTYAIKFYGYNGNYPCYIKNIIEINTTNLQDMSYMFRHCTALQSIDFSNLNMEKLINIKYMFYNCTSLQSVDLSNLSISNITSTEGMFSGCTSLTSVNLSNFDTSNIIKSDNMFTDVPELEWKYDGTNYANWDLVEREVMYSYLFPWSTYYMVEYTIDTSSTSNTVGRTVSNGRRSIYQYLPTIYSDADNPSLPPFIKITKTDLTETISLTTKVSEIDSIKAYYPIDTYSLQFYGDSKTICNYITSIINIETEGLQDMSNMFYYCTSLETIDVTNWLNDNIDSLAYMFYGCSSLSMIEGIDTWEGNQVSNIKYMFFNCTSLQTVDLSNLSTSNITSTESMFSGCTSLTSVNLSTWDTSKIKEATNMFTDVPELEWNYDGTNYANWDLVEREVMYSYLFPWSNYYLVEYTIDTSSTSNTVNKGSYNGIRSIYQYLPVVYSSADNFSLPPFIKITKTDLTETISLTTKVSEVNSIKAYYPIDTYSLQFYGNTETSGNYITSIISIETEGLQDMSYMFRYCTSLTSIDLSTWNIGNMTTSSYMFSGCISLQTVDLFGWDTSNLTDCSYMFNNCTSLQTVDLSSWDTSSITTSTRLFYNCPTDCIAYYNSETWDLPTSGTGFSVTWIDPFNKYTIDTTLLESDTVQLYDNNSSYGIRTIWGDNTCDKELTHTYDLFNVDDTVTIYTSLHNNPIPSLIYEIIENTESQEVSNYLPTITNLEENTPATEGYKYALFELTDGTVTDDLTTHIQYIKRVYISYDVDKISSISFENNTLLKSIERIELGSGVNSTQNMFLGCTGLEKVGKFNFAEDTNIKFADSMFNGCTSLTSLDLSNWDTSYMTGYIDMFKDVPEIEDFNYDENNYNKWALSNTNVGYGYDFPWNFYTTEYTIGVDKISHTINHSYNTVQYYLPTIMDANKRKITITDNLITVYLLDGSISTLGLSTLAKDVASIKVKYPKDASSITFSGVSANELHCVREIKYLKIPSNMTTMTKMFYYSRIEKINDIATWDLSNIIYMNYTFHGCAFLKTLDLTCWNISNIIEITRMFRECTALESINISNWNTGKVINMKEMFYNCTSLKSLNLSSFVTSEVTEMKHMFYGCSSLKSIMGLANFNTAKVTSFQSLFEKCSSLENLNGIYNWNTAKVTSLENMFYGCSSLTSLDLSGWEITSKLTYMPSAFCNCTSLVSVDLSGWDTSSVTNMKSLFDSCTALSSINLSGWNTTNITSQSDSFKNCKIINWINYNDENYANVNLVSTTCMYISFFPWENAFDEENYIIYVPYIANSDDTLGLKATNSDFSYIPDITYLGGSVYSKFVSKEKYLVATLNDGTETSDMSTPITDVKEIKYYIPKGYGISFNVTDSYSKYIKEIKEFKSNTMYIFKNVFSSYYLESFDSKNIHITQDIQSLSFEYCKLVKNIDLSNFNLNNLTTMENMFYHCEVVNDIVFPDNLDTTNITSMKNLFSHCEQVASLDISTWNTINVTDMSYMFYFCEKLSKIKGIEDIDTSNLTDMNYMFRSCSTLTSLDLSKWNTAKLKSIENFIYDCKSLLYLDVSGWIFNNSMSSNNNYGAGVKVLIARNCKIVNTSQTPFVFTLLKIVNLEYMDLTNLQIQGSISYEKAFYGCTVLKHIEGVESLVTNNVTSMKSMFQNCRKLVLPSDLISNWDVSNVQTMEAAFVSCESISTLDLPNWNVSNKLTSVQQLFGSCIGLRNVNLSGWNTSNVTSMQAVFSGCKALNSVNLSGWNTSNVTTMSNMFSECKSLTSLDVSNFNTSNVTTMSSMFNRCSKLTSLNLSNFNTSSVTNMGSMFSECTSLTSLNLSNFNTSNVTIMGSMFLECTSLTSLNLSNFNTRKVTSSSDMFKDVPTTIEWGYDRTNYTNWTLKKSSTGYSGTFPWTI